MRANLSVISIPVHLHYLLSSFTFVSHILTRFLVVNFYKLSYGICHVLHFSFYRIELLHRAAFKPCGNVLQGTDVTIVQKPIVKGPFFITEDKGLPENEANVEETVKNIEVAKSNEES